ncbi:hypothetical protein [Burkholderia contaminans]|uniref:hypothetical protein n=1 Tax=Burkholderia contaminans TaxID=488447 RepID=UPI00158392EC|nr:hypothetical protein [Burkholderia contaminans]
MATDRGDPSKLNITRSYRCENLQAIDCNGYCAGQAKEFSQENFEQHVKERFECYLESYEVTDERRAELWRDIVREILDRSHDRHSMGALTDQTRARTRNAAKAWGRRRRASSIST